MEKGHGVVAEFKGASQKLRNCPIQMPREINKASNTVLLLLSVFGVESAIRPDSLQLAGALGLLHQLLAMDVVDAEGLDDGAEGEDKTRGNGRHGTFDKDITRRDECE